MSENGDDEKFDKAIERMLDVREKNKTVVSLLIIISLFLLLFLLVQFFQSPQVMVIRTSSNELPSENEIKNFSIPEIIYKSLESKIKKRKLKF
jgi:hypothetical protein